MKNRNTCRKKKIPKSTVHLTPQQVAFLLNAMEAFRCLTYGYSYPRDAWDNEAYKSLTENNGEFDVGRCGIGQTVCRDNGAIHVWRNDFDDEWHGYRTPRVVSCGF